MMGLPGPDDRVFVRLYDYTGRHDVFPLAGATLNGSPPSAVVDAHTLEFPREAVRPGWNVFEIGPEPKAILGGIVLSLTGA